MYVYISVGSRKQADVFKSLGLPDRTENWLANVYRGPYSYERPNAGLEEL